MFKQRLVVVGNGMTGARFLEELIARGGADAYDITAFGDEPYGNYNRILLSGVLSGTHEVEDILMTPLQWYEKHGIKLHLNKRAERIDRESKTVYGADGIIEPYDKLVIATGSVPFVPPFDGLGSPNGGWKQGVFVFRSLDDCNKIMSYAANTRRAAVLGGGLLGLEAARGLLNMGLDVHVVHLMDHLMETQLDPDAGAMLQRDIEALGVQLYLNKRTSGLLGEERIEGIAFADGSTLDCDMLVISAGIRANVQLAREAGLDVERGIVIQDTLACSNDPDIYAIGECAQYQGQVYGLVGPCWDQARVLAERLCSADCELVYAGSKVVTKLKVMGIDLSVMGEKEPKIPTDEVVTYKEPSRNVYKKLIIRDNQLAGAIHLGEAMAPAMTHLFESGATLPANRAELLFSLSGGSQDDASLADLPDSAQVCNCNGVSKGTLVAAAQNGAPSLKAVCDSTRAGTGCGSCKSLVQAILEQASAGGLTEDPSVHYYVPGIPLTKPELIEAIEAQSLHSVSAVFAALANGKEDAGSKPGLASLLRTIWGKDYEDERDARFINDRVHANVQNNGTFSVVPRIYGGVTSAKELRRIADTAEKYNVPMVKITGGQRIDLLGIPKEQLPDVWADLEMPSGHAYTKAFRTCKTCIGTEFCRYGVGDSTTLGVAIEQRFQGIESPHKMKLAVSGCPRNCAESTTKDVGAVAIEGGKWEIYIGGAAGSRVRKGDVLCVVDSHEETLLYIGRFMQFYREQAKYLERTYDFVERRGIAYLREVLVDDTEGICDRLDKAMAASVDSYVDPWQEGMLPMHPTQFSAPLAEAGAPVGALR